MRISIQRQALNLRLQKLKIGLISDADIIKDVLSGLIESELRQHNLEKINHIMFKSGFSTTREGLNNILDVFKPGTMFTTCWFVNNKNLHYLHYGPASYDADQPVKSQFCMICGELIMIKAPGAVMNCGFIDIYVNCLTCEGIKVVYVRDIEQIIT